MGVKAKFISDLLYNELLVLEVVCFDMSFEHPYYDMLEFVKEVGSKYIYMYIL